MIVNFKKWICTVSLASYDNNRVAILVNELTTGDPILIATVNLPEQELEEDEVFIKDWSENAGIYETLVRAGLILRYQSWVNLGGCNAYRCKLVSSLSTGVGI